MCRPAAGRYCILTAVARDQYCLLSYGYTVDLEGSSKAYGQAHTSLRSPYLMFTSSMNSFMPSDSSSLDESFCKLRITNTASRSPFSLDHRPRCLPSGGSYGVLLPPRCMPPLPRAANLPLPRSPLCPVELRSIIGSCGRFHALSSSGPGSNVRAKMPCNCVCSFGYLFNNRWNSASFSNPAKLCFDTRWVVPGRSTFICTCSLVAISADCPFSSSCSCLCGL